MELGRVLIFQRQSLPPVTTCPRELKDESKENDTVCVCVSERAR